jgi:hypothetical protein
MDGTRTVAAYCLTHGDEILARGTGPYTLLRPDPTTLSTPPQPQQEHAPMTDTHPPITTEMAPPDAVFDEDARVEIPSGPSTEEASTNFFWRFGNQKVFDLQTTVRGTPTEPQMRAHLHSVVDTLKAVVAMGGVSKTAGYQTAPAVPAPTPTPAPVTGPAPGPAGPTPGSTVGNGTPAPTPAPVAAPAPVPAPSAPGQKTQYILTATKLEITQRPDGKVQLDFFLNTERKYADLRHIDSPENALRFLSRVGGWAPEHFRGAGTYTVSYDVTWEESTKMNNAGRPYKNIVGIAVHA